MKGQKLYVFIATIFIQILVIWSQDILPSFDSIKNFPSIYGLEDYNKCTKTQPSFYCGANFRVVPENNGSKLWSEMESWSNNLWHYNHRILHRTLCIPKIYNSYSSQKSFVENVVNKELKPYNLTAEMFSIECQKEHSGYFYLLVLLTLAYISFVIYATRYDNRSPHDKNDIKRKWMSGFSLTSNWRRMVTYKDKNPDFKRLNCIQGIRTYNTILVISAHSMLSWAQLYIKNTEKMEELCDYNLIQLITIFITMIVQTYFVISSWLITNQILELHKKNGRFTFRDGMTLFVNRVTRFWPSLIVMLLIAINVGPIFLNGPLTFELSNFLDRTCSNNWWATLFQVTNMLYPKDVCNLGMWSLSNDTQYYVLLIIFWYVVLNYKVSLKKSLIYLFTMVYLVNIVTFYTKDLGIVATLTPETCKRVHFFQDVKLPWNYFGFWVNYPSSLVGVFFGYLYFVTKNDKNQKPYEYLCGPLFATLPLFVVFLGWKECGKLESALMGPLLKPLFSVGIAAGILGMSRNVIQGPAKTICENKYAVLLANFSFSTYVFHFLMVFNNGIMSDSLVEISEFKEIVSMVIDNVSSWALGICCALIIEQPGINIKKILLPQVAYNKEMSKNNCCEKDKNINNRNKT